LETEAGELILNENRPTVELVITNLGDRPVAGGEPLPFYRGKRVAEIWIGGKAYGMRARHSFRDGGTVEPGDTKTVRLVQIAGLKVIRGGNGLADGPVSDIGKVDALKRVG